VLRWLLDVARQTVRHVAFHILLLCLIGAGLVAHSVLRYGSCNNLVRPLAGVAFLLDVPSDEEIVAGLQQDAADMAARIQDRPTHADPPRPGAFDKGLLAALEPLAEIWKDLDAQRQRHPKTVRAALKGQGPIADIPPAWRVAVDGAKPHLDALFAATEAETLGGAIELRPMRVEGDFGAWEDTSTLTLAIDLFAARISFAVERGDADPALTDCVGLQALARDLRRLPPTARFAGRARAAARPQCNAAVLGASGAALDQARTTLQRIADAPPNYAVTSWAQFWVRSASVHYLLDGESRASLPATVRSFTATKPGRYSWQREDTRLGRVLVRRGWLSDRHWQRLTLVPGGLNHGDARDAVLAEEQRLQRLWSFSERDLRCDVPMQLKLLAHRETGRSFSPAGAQLLAHVIARQAELTASDYPAPSPEN